MELFRKAAVWQSNKSAPDWTRDYGYSDDGEFPFPDLYLDPKVAKLAAEDPGMVPFLNECLENFVNHEYGHMSSLTLVENLFQREIHKAYTWMTAIYPSPSWGEVHLDLFYDIGLFHLEEVAPRELAKEQAAKEKAAKG